ncbi:protein ACCELERATED CELL DEATH 6-like [Humulus lupulus]|uniref:protein ACCELERATED CELL DEATH 6-like n=1 Tax=Humulus lupulus TaxID=3486 RepID=UPI002B40B7E2|nr:protein ACCELERATED CELL DEATH 6-like [Humulus lupulus]
MLLDKVDFLTKQADDDGCIPLHYVAMNRKNVVEITKMLLKNNESSAYIKHKKGMTALHIAAYNEYYDHKIMKEILTSCPDSYEEVDDEGRNVLHHAVTTTYLSNVKFILEHASSLILNIKDKDGNTPLLHMAATSSWNLLVLKALLSHPQVNRMSLNNQNNNIRDVYMLQFPIREKELIKRFKESSLVTSTSIATVTFAAGISMPGGYITEEVGHRKESGSAALRNSVVFQFFIITNTMALLPSALSVFFFNILLNITYVEGEHGDAKLKNYKLCMRLTIWALAFMMLAFVTGTSATLSLSTVLVIPVLFIGWIFGLCISFWEVDERII